MLSLLDLVYTSDVISIVRSHLSRLPLLELFKLTSYLMAIITDISTYPAAYFEIDGPYGEMLPVALLDVLFGGITNRPGTNLLFVNLISYDVIF